MARTAKKKIQVYNDGILIADDPDSLNFAGAGVDGMYNPATGQVTETIGSSGSGVTPETPTPAADGVTTVFAVTGQPKWITSDGVTLYEGHGYSYAALTITLDLAPSYFLQAIL